MEIWKDIFGFEGLYQVSNQGKVKSLYYGKEKVLKSGSSRIGYPFVILRKDNKSHYMTVHLLVFYSFNNVAKVKGMVIDHIDNDKTNNNINNLQRITQRENCTKDKKNSYSIYTGVRKSTKGSKKPWMAQCKIKSKNYNLGTFDTELEAHLARVEFIKNIKD